MVCICWQRKGAFPGENQEEILPGICYTTRNIIVPQ